MSRVGISDLQKQFQNHVLYKRSKRYLDIERLNKLQRTQQIIRRSPKNSQKSLDNKTYQTFTNSYQTLEVKRQFDINLHRKSLADMDDPQTYYTNSTIDNGVRSPRMNKMISREQSNKSRTPRTSYQDQSRFNNFQTTRFRPRVSINFAKSKQQSFRNSVTIQQNPMSQLQKKEQIYQKLYFNNATFRCVFDYGKYRKKQNVKKDPNQHQRQPKPFPIISTLKQTRIGQFYHRSGRQMAGQLHRKYLKSNEYQFLSYDQFKKKNDFSMKAAKLQLLGKRKAQYLESKRVISNRDQMCDLKYFRKVHFKI